MSEDYTDNYDQTEFNKTEEFITTYGTNLSFGLFQKTAQFVLSYNPEFKDYDKRNEYDALEHNASLVGEFLPSKRSSIDFNLNYDGHGDNNESESWEHSASLAGSYELSKYTGTIFSADYTNSYDRQLRTNDWNESKSYTLSGGIKNQFGQKDFIGFDYSYSMTDYVGPDSDDYDEHNPSIFLAYWFNPQFGFDSNLSYEYTVYDLSDDTSKTWSGDFRLIRNITKHFDIYTKYEHTYTIDEQGDHTIYNPSVGFDWSVTEDSGVSLGLGYMIQKWENSEDSEGLFVDADVFKAFKFSKQGTFTVSAASGYDATSNDAASLGFQIYYQAGFLLSYQFLRDLSAQLTGSYTRDQFDDPDVNRVDDTIEFGAGLAWAPWKWMNIDLGYTFEDFSSDDDLIENYQENRGTIMVTLYPAGTPRMISAFKRGQSDFERGKGGRENKDGDTIFPSAADRADIENKIFNNAR
ncbi:MAG: outer membrane beta-barrel protein [Desulfamplus sp.]|nr:outer membrane beta-barrel protein [Desulfamplus sp.]